MLTWLMAIPKWLLKKTIANQREKVQAKLGGQQILIEDPFANFFGVRSRTPFQLRGNGFLAATTEEVVFLMLWPARMIRIPRARMTGMNRTRFFLGKTVGHPLLEIRFNDEAGRPDAAAWLVRDLAAWEAALGLPLSDPESPVA